MNNTLKDTLKDYVVAELKSNTGPGGLDASAACADLVVEKVFDQIDGLVKKETTWERQMKILAQLTPKKKSRPKPKAKVKPASETTAAVA